MNKDQQIKASTIAKIWFKISIFSFGGAAVLPSLAEDEFVRKRCLLTDEEFLNLYARSKMVPGALNVSMAIIIGYYLGGWKAGMAAVLGLSFPSLLMICLVFTLLKKVASDSSFEHFFQGVKPVIPGLVGGIAFRMGRVILKKWKDLVLAGLLALAVAFFHFDSWFVLILSAVGGLILFFPERK